METEKADKSSGTNEEPTTTLVAVSFSSLEKSVNSNKDVKDNKDPNNLSPGPSSINDEPITPLETVSFASSEDSVKSSKGVKNNEDPNNSSPEPSSTSLNSVPFMPSPTLSNYSISATQSPIVQVMGKGYDPNRIPQSVFSSKPSVGWSLASLASNESLFSIYIGNGSFNQDQFMYVMERSYVQTKLPEPIESSETQKSNSLPTVNEAAEADRMSTDSEDSVVREGAAEAATKEASIVPKEDQQQQQQIQQQSVDKVVDLSLSYKSRSSASTNSAKSFAFPLLPIDGERNSPAVPVMDILQITRNTKTVEVIDEEQSLGSSTSRSKLGNLMKENQDKRNQTSLTSPKEAPTSWGSCINSWCPCFSWCICW